MNPLQKIGEYGQSIWLDFISRKALQSGELQEFIDNGVVGMTSNPAIFEKAMSGSDYDVEIAERAKLGQSASQIYEGLAIEDVQGAADLLKPIYTRTSGLDGYVSLEVSPLLARNTPGTVEQAVDFWGRLRRDNVMIKIPATVEGIPAVTEVLSLGINVNVTLLFSVPRYEAIIDAYMSGIEKLIEAGGNPKQVRSVASFFLSRIDTLVDGQLDAKGTAEAKALEGKAAIASAKVAYASYQKAYETPRWKALSAKGANPQRLLWASTSTKNPAYPDTMYVEALIGPDTVNTVPTETIHAYIDHGNPASRLTEGIEVAPKTLQDIGSAGVDVAACAVALEEEGLVKFVEPFNKLEKLLETKRTAALTPAGIQN